MKASVLKGIIGWLLILTQLSCLTLVTIFYALGRMAFSEFSTLLTIIAPIIGVYASAAFSYFTSKSSYQVSVNEFPLNYSIVMLVYATSFASFLIVPVVIRGLGLGLANFDHLKAVVALSETFFGAYLVKVTNELFVEH